MMIYVGLAVLTILHVIDIVQTRHAILTGGYESNPLMASVIDRFGFVGLAAAKTAALALVAVVVIFWPAMWLVLAAALFVEVWTVLGNAGL